MARVLVFADESGNFDFSPRRGASKYFILTSITCDSFTVGDALLALRRDLAWKGKGLNSEFHASTDAQDIRDEVFNVIQRLPLRVDATVLEKAKTRTHVRETEERFYKTAWYLHMKHVAPRVVGGGDELLVVSASIGTRKKRRAMYDAVCDVVRQVSPTTKFRTAAWDASSDPCLQAADYCCWAISRKWESGDCRSYGLIASKVQSEFDVFRRGRTIYY